MGQLMYVKALAILLLLSGLIAGCWKLYDAGKQAGKDEVKAELLALTNENLKLRQRAETKILDERPVWNERKEKARTVAADCSLPAVHVGVLRESGIFTGPSG